MDTDLALLHEYTRTQDANAFAELVRRHAGMVYGVCLRITKSRHDAEDVAQACFLELARRGGTIVASVSGWLHATATCRALDAIRNAATRRRHEQRAWIRADSGAEPKWQAISPHVDQALEELPEELRFPLLLHYLEGRRQADIASELGVNQSTVSRRIEKGLAQLRGKLKRAGAAAPVAALGALLDDNAACAAPATLNAELGKMAMAGIGPSVASLGVLATILALSLVVVCVTVAYMQFANPKQMPPAKAAQAAKPTSRKTEAKPAAASRASAVQKDVAAAVKIISGSLATETKRLNRALNLIKPHPQPEALRELIAWLAAEKANERRAAIHAIKSLTWDDPALALAPLERLLLHDEAATRAAAATALGSLGVQDATDALLDTVTHGDDAAARRCAAWAVGELRRIDAIEILKDIDLGDDRALRDTAINAIERLEFLREQAHLTGDAREVTHGVWILAGSGHSQSHRINRALEIIRSVPAATRDPLLRQFRSSKIASVRRAAVLATQQVQAIEMESTGSVKEDVAVAVRLLASTAEGDTSGVAQALRLIEPHPKDEALRVLVELLDSENAAERRGAIYAIQTLRCDDPGPARAALRKCLSHQDSRTRGMAARAVAALGGRDAGQALLAILRSKRGLYARFHAAWAIGELGDTRLTDALRTVEPDEHIAVRLLTKTSLERLLLLAQYESLPGDARPVIRGVWTIAGAALDPDPDRIDRALAMIRSVPEATRDPLLAELGASRYESIRDAAKLARTRIAER